MEAKTTKMIAAVAVIVMCAAGLVGAGYAYTASTENSGNDATSEYVVLSQAGTGAYKFANQLMIYYDTTNPAADTFYYKLNGDTVDLDTNGDQTDDHTAKLLGNSFTINARDTNRAGANLTIAIATTGFTQTTGDWKYIIAITDIDTPQYIVTNASSAPSGSFTLVWDNPTYETATVSVYYGYPIADKANGATTAPTSMPLVNASMTFTATIEPATNYISLDSTSLVMGASATLKAALHNGATGNITWTSSNTGVVTVSGNGTTCTLAGVANGTAIITAKVTVAQVDYVVTCYVTVEGLQA